jgi:hypothetical protein
MRPHRASGLRKTKSTPHDLTAPWAELERPIAEKKSPGALRQGPFCPADASGAVPSGRAARSRRLGAGDRSPFWREESSGCNCRFFLYQLDFIAFDAGYLAFVEEEMLRVEGIFLDQLDPVAFNLVHNANMLAVGVDNFHMFADFHSVSPEFAA